MSSSSAAAGPVRVALVGMGWVARLVWLPLVRRHPGLSLAAVVDPSAEARSIAVGDRGVALLADVDELSPHAVDLAVVAAPNHLHCALACSLLERDINVFVEKPVCLTSREVARMARAEQSHHAVLLAGSATRYREDIGALQGIQHSLGRIRRVELSWVRARGVPDAGGWFTRRSLAGGGALFDLGWHLLDLASTLVGPLVVGHVGAAVTADFVGEASARAAWRGDQADVGGPAAPDVEDNALGFLVTGEGVAISLRASWASHEAVDVSRVVLEGTAGIATLTCTFGFSPNRVPQPTLTVTRSGRAEAVALPEEPLGAEHGRQVDAILQGLANPDTGRGMAIEEAGRIVDIIERMYRSSAPFTTPSLLPAPIPDLEAVIFDLDGVLVNSTHVMREAFRIAYAEVVGEGEAPFDEYARHMGRYFPDIMRSMGLPLAMEEPFVRESSRLAHLVMVFDGIREMLQALRARGLRLAVATGKSGVRARRLLDQLDLLPLLDCVVGSDEVKRPKPAPDIVLRALGLLRVQPRAAVMIGDAPADLQSARGAGVAAIAAAWGECDLGQLVAEGPDMVLHRPDDILTVCSSVEVISTGIE